ncbi:MAG: MarR family transcriptional regulator [Bacteroidota bacterium]
MRRINVSLHQRIRPIDVDRLGPLGTMVLDVLADIEPAPIQKLNQKMARDKSQMTRTIKLLESKKLIVRDPSPEDGRTGILSLTPKGRTFVQEVRRAMSELMREVLEPITPEQREQLLELLKQL